VAKTTIINTTTIIKIKIPVVLTLVILKLASNKDLNSSQGIFPLQHNNEVGKRDQAHNILAKTEMCSLWWASFYKLKHMGEIV
jgi:hypothetical protein